MAGDAIRARFSRMVNIWEAGRIVALTTYADVLLDGLGSKLYLRPSSVPTTKVLKCFVGIK